MTAKTSAAAGYTGTTKPTAMTKPIGHGNAQFLADLATGTPDKTMREHFKAGRYTPLHTPSVQGWRKLAGRGS